VTDALSIRIRQARDEAGFTQEQMAPMIGVTLRTLSRYESGETTRVSVEKLEQIAIVTGKPVSWFLNGVREGQRA